MSICAWTRFYGTCKRSVSLWRQVLSILWLGFMGNVCYMQGCESSDFNLISDFFLLFTKPHFQTFNALKSTSFQAFQNDFRLFLTDALSLIPLVIAQANCLQLVNENKPFLWYWIDLIQGALKCEVQKSWFITTESLHIIALPTEEFYRKTV